MKSGNRPMRSRGPSVPDTVAGIRSRKSLRALLALVTGAAAATFSACGGTRAELPLEPVSIELLEYLPVAHTAGTVEALPPTPASATGGVRMRPGSRLTFHFQLPQSAELVGEWTVQGSDSSAGLRLTLRSEGGSPPRRIDLSAAALASGDAASCREDLSDFSGRMVELRFSVEGESEVLWRRLRIDGKRVRLPPAEIPREHYNVVIVLLDALRQDHLEPYGASTVRTPQLAKFADLGTTFVNARSNASWTRPAIASMLSSLLPPAHGVLNLHDPLNEHIPYLPEILQQAGYRTLAISKNPVVSRVYGVGRGFDRMIELWKTGQLVEASDDPEAHAKSLWRRHLQRVVRSDQPFFIYLHEIDPHSPYEPPSPYRELYDSDYEGDVGSSRLDLWKMNQNPDRVGADDVRHLSALYRGEIAYMDRYVGWILDRLQDPQIARPTLVVFTSDHGEEFWEHRSLGHSSSVFDELLRVPLILRLDGVLPAGRRVRANVSLADLAPTILDLLGLKIPGAMQGQSLLPLVSAPTDERLDRASVARSLLPPLEALTLGRFKLVRRIDDPSRSVALYDLESDPEEREDRAEDLPIVTATLKQRLDWHDYTSSRDAAEARPPVATEALEPEQLERLRELGYLP